MRLNTLFMASLTVLACANVQACASDNNYYNGNNHYNNNDNDNQGVALGGEWVVLVNGVCYGSIAISDAPDCSQLMGSLSEGCQRAGYDKVRVIFYNNQGEFDDLRTTFACAYQQDSTYLPGQFDTTPIDILQYGQYQYAWQALDASNKVLKTSPRGALDLAPPDSYKMLETVLFDEFHPNGTDASLSTSWDVTATGATLSERCTARGVSEVGLEVRRFDDTVSTPVLLTKASCAAGMLLTTALLAKGKYLFDYVFLDSMAQVVGRSAFINLSIPGTGSFNVNKGTLP